ncbi:MAG: flagella basal body P-ring formation protein FlgA [Myxococcota bacterium]
MVVFLMTLSVVAPREVLGERIVLADLLKDVPADIAALDIAASPDPGHRRVIRGSLIRQRLREARVLERGLRIPKRTSIVRAAQTLTEGEIENLVHALTVRTAPRNVRVSSVRARGALRLPKGEIGGRIEWPRRVRSGPQSLRVVITVDDTPITTVLVSSNLVVHESTTAVDRGARVGLLARIGAVEVRGIGIAQEKGRVGQNIRVLPDGAVRVVEGRVLADGRIEVRP